MHAITEDLLGIKRVCVQEVIDIPVDTPTDKRFEMGAEAKTRLREALVDAIWPFVECQAYTPGPNKFKTCATVIVVDPEKMKVRESE